MLPKNIIMKKILTLILIAVAFDAQAQSLGCGLDVMPESEITYGCGCGYYYQTKPTLKPILQSKHFDFSELRVSVNGKMGTAEPINIEQIPTTAQVDSTFQQHYRLDGVDIILNNTVSFKCPAGSEGCEVLSFDVDAIVSSENCELTLTGLFGDCGC